MLNFLHVISGHSCRQIRHFMFVALDKGNWHAKKGQRFVLPILWKWRDLVRRLIGAGFEVSKVSGNCQVLI
jgi:hypothetical protein